MKTIALFFLKSFASITVTMSSWFIFLFVYHFSFGEASIFSLGLGIVFFFLLSFLEKVAFLRRNKLTRQEYKYIKQNLKEAEQKIQRLQKTFFRARSIDSWKVLLDINRLCKRIYQLVKKEPKRFYQAETFFFYHLDSCLELAEKYTALSSQPIRDVSVRKSLEESKEMLRDLNKELEQDLLLVLRNDLEHLQFEMDVAKKQIQKR